jgi:hypothetical protein
VSGHTDGILRENLQNLNDSFSKTVRKCSLQGPNIYSKFAVLSDDIQDVVQVSETNSSATIQVIIHPLISV